MSTAEAPSRKTASTLLLIGCLWLVFLAAGFYLRLQKGFEHDELEHLHAAWNVGQGLLPYRDFFEHHPPLFYYLLAPFARHRQWAGDGFLLACRLAAVGALLIALAGLYCVLKRVTQENAILAIWGVGAYLLLFSLSDKLFELRPDWFALILLIGAILLLAPAAPRAEGRQAHDRNSGKHAGDSAPAQTPVARPESLRWQKALAAGVLGGLAFCLTQKSLALLAGMTLWLFLAWLAGADGDTRRARAKNLLAFAVGMALPVALLIGFFVGQGAGRLLYENIIGINLRWAREADWQHFWRLWIPVALGWVALALTAMIRIALAWRENLRAASPRSLAALLALLGLASYLRTPVPHEQSLLFLVTPWFTALAVARLAEYLAEPALFRSDWAWLAGTACLCLLPVPFVLTVKAVAVWLPVGALLWLLLSRPAPARGLPHLAFALLLLPPLYGFLRSMRTLPPMLEAAAQQRRYVARVRAELRPGEPILMMWGHTFPFHPSPAYHWFAHGGILRSIAPQAIEEEYLRILREKRVRIVVITPTDARAYLPRFLHYLETRCSLLDERGAYLCE